MGSVLVTGASGFIGLHVARRLVERGEEVVCLIRRSSNVERLRPLGVRLVYGDVTDRQSVRDAVAGRRVVYHVAGRTRALRRRQLFETNAGGTGHVAEACAAADDPPVMVMISSLAAAGPSPPDRPKREDDPPRPVSHYGHSKLAGERAASKLAGRFPLTIVRPPIVLGEGDRSGVGLFRSVVKMGLHPVPSWRRYRYSVIHAADLAELLVRAAARGTRVEGGAAVPGHPPPAPSPCTNPPAGLYYAAAEEDLSYADLGRLIARCAGQRVLVVPISSPMVWMIAAGGGGVGHLLRRPVYLNLDKAREATTGHWTCSPARAAEHLGFHPAAPLPERLRETLAWYRAEGWL